MKTVLEILKENIDGLIELNQSDIDYAKKVDSSSLHFKFIGIKQGFEMALKEIEQLLPTEQSQTESLKKEIDRYKELYEDYSSEVEELQLERRNLEKEIEELKKKTEWISVKERLPEFNIDVLVRGEKMGANPSMDGASTFIAHRQNPKGTSLERQAYKYVDDNYFKAKYVTHWMPLPTPPNQ